MRTYSSLQKTESATENDYDELDAAVRDYFYGLEFLSPERLEAAKEIAHDLVQAGHMRKVLLQKAIEFVTLGDKHVVFALEVRLNIFYFMFYLVGES